MAASGNVRYSQIRSGDRSGTGAKVATVTGTLTTGKQLEFDASGNVVASSSNVGGSSNIGLFSWFGAVTPPSAGSYTWVNQGSAASAQAGSNLWLQCPASASNSLRIFKRTAPATPWVVTVGFIYSMHQPDFAEAGLCYRESGSGKLVTLNAQFGSATFYVTSSKWTDPTTFSAAYTLSPNAFLSPSSVAWLRIADNGTNRISSWSIDGENWEALHTVSRTDFLTADEWGFYMNSANSQVIRMSIFHTAIA